LVTTQVQRGRTLLYIKNYSLNFSELDIFYNMLQ
jgi:hypothetical protein